MIKMMNTTQITRNALTIALFGNLWVSGDGMIFKFIELEGGNIKLWKHK